MLWNRVVSCRSSVLRPCATPRPDASLCVWPVVVTSQKLPEKPNEPPPVSCARPINPPALGLKGPIEDTAPDAKVLVMVPPNIWPIKPPAVEKFSLCAKTAPVA